MAIHRNKDSRLVYSSGKGRTCSCCSLPVTECKGRKDKANPTGDGIVRLKKEVKGRRGKTVTTISGVPLDGKALLELASRLKRRCGSGGSVKEGVIEIQGDHRDILVAELEKQGYTVKQAGG